jgi:hypothetical protein
VFLAFQAACCSLAQIFLTEAYSLGVVDCVPGVLVRPLGLRGIYDEFYGQYYTVEHGSRFHQPLTVGDYLNRRVANAERVCTVLPGL